MEMLLRDINAYNPGIAILLQGKRKNILIYKVIRAKAGPLRKVHLAYSD